MTPADPPGADAGVEVGDGFLNNGADLHLVIVRGSPSTNVVVESDVEMQLTTPATAPGLIDVEVSNANGSGSARIPGFVPLMGRRGAWALAP